MVTITTQAKEREGSRFNVLFTIKEGNVGVMVHDSGAFHFG